MIPCDLRRAVDTADAVIWRAIPTGRERLSPLAMVLAQPSKFEEQEASTGRFKKREVPTDGARKNRKPRLRKGFRDESEFPRDV